MSIAAAKMKKEGKNQKKLENPIAILK